MAQPLILSLEPQLRGVTIVEKVTVEHSEHQRRITSPEKTGFLLTETEDKIDNSLLPRVPMGTVDKIFGNINEASSGNTAAGCPKTRQDATEDEESAVAKDLPKYTMEEITRHNTSTDLWVVIDNDVYDMTEFQHKHPGGYKVMRGVAGKDATKKFDKYHRRAVLVPKKEALHIGTVNESSQLDPKHKKSLLRRFSFGFGFGSNN
ncbi:unnamed protein product [Clonostachys rosea]|uniref:Cytochrome b5 heme-binding domain-containing protein n=1 Tax=Bionectria ochroleuca TaxID=29856 RepID=A0ABY6UPR8_BIOOC|nr:unnamed protein product [Clonostachys rosea]